VDHHLVALARGAGIEAVVEGCLREDDRHGHAGGVEHPQQGG
jgi:hypothetical protein